MKHYSFYFLLYKLLFSNRLIYIYNKRLQVPHLKKPNKCKVYVTDFSDTPGAPGTPKCIDFNEDSITLSWSAPKSDGGNLVKGYTVEKREKGKPDWVK